MTELKDWLNNRLIDEVECLVPDTIRFVRWYTDQSAPVAQVICDAQMEINFNHSDPLELAAGPRTGQGKVRAAIPRTFISLELRRLFIA